mgnify:CR=1 FL=1
MLILNVEWMIRLRGSKHPYAYLINNGYSKQEARTLLSKQTKRLDLGMMQRLMATFSCEMNDLFDWVGDPKDAFARYKKPELPELQSLLEGKSPDEILVFFRKLKGDEK